MLRVSAVLVALGGALAETQEERIVRTFKGKDFLWGTATAAYQIEGAWNEDGRQQSIWDVFAHGNHTFGNESGDVADDFYHRWKSDLDMLKSYSMNSFRMSISWSRIFPRGPDGLHRANPLGVAFYKKVIGYLLEIDVLPFVTLFHWDLPDDLDWLEDEVVDAYVEYAEFMFETFPEVKNWLTFNEPYTFCPSGYGSGRHAPGVKSEFKQYICGHNVLRAHARAVEVFRDKQKKGNSKGGQIGITINYDWAYPWNASSLQDQAAAQLHHDFVLGWWADPIWVSGDYPPSMRHRLGDHLPTFTSAEQERLRGSADFFGMNIYTGGYAYANKTELSGYVSTHVGMDGKEIGRRGASPWLYVVPDAMRQFLVYVHNRYGPGAIYITENGCDVPGEHEAKLEDALNDTFRVNYYREYLAAAAEAVSEFEVPLKGFFAWSLMDNYEWADGYHFRFGLTYVNYTDQTRHPKASAKWYSDIIKQVLPAPPGAEAHPKLAQPSVELVV